MDSGLNQVGVVGMGLMGSGIAQVAATRGLRTVAVDVTEELVKRGLDGIKHSLTRMARAHDQSQGRKGVSRAESDATLQRLTASTRLEDILDCDIVIEAIPENEDGKTRLYARLGQIGYTKLLVSNTSSISITRLGSAFSRPDRFMGMHFMNPVPVQKGCELIRGILTSEETFQAVVAFSKELGKEPILAEDEPGFGINRMLVPFLTEAIRVVEQGIMTCEDADKMTLCAGHAMGPITTVDYVGLDTTLAIGYILEKELGEAYRPPQLLKKLVSSGFLGLKSGKGFYIWENGHKAGVNPCVARYRRG